LSMYPVLLGVRYRLSTDDIVPYVGIAAGPTFVTRRASFDYNVTTFDEQKTTVLAAEMIAGLEFFFSPRAGIRLAISGYYVRLPSRIYDTGANPGSFPIFTYQANPISLRYSSGVFFLF